MKLLLFPGLAANEKLFTFQKQFLSQIEVPAWLPPMPNESLSDYAKRWSQNFANDVPFAIGGMSFGGQLALEMAKFLPVKKVLLIATHKESDEISPAFKIQQKTMHLLSDQQIKVTLKKMGIPLINCKENLQVEHKQLLSEMVEELDVPYLRWSAWATAHWRFRFSDSDYKMPVFQIHGEHDDIIRLRNTRNTHVIKGARHLINFTHSKEVNEWLSQHISPPS